MQTNVEEWDFRFGHFDQLCDEAKSHCQAHYENQKSEGALLANIEEIYVAYDFNGIRCVIGRNTDTKLLNRDYLNAFYMEWKEIGPECVQEYSAEQLAELNRRKEAAAEQAARESEIQQAEDDKQKDAVELTIADEPMKFISAGGEDEWEKGLAKNQDPYGGACYEYAEYWARLMQAKSKSLDVEIDNKFMEQHASDLSDQLGYIGITGFMYGAVISILSECWKYG